MLYLKFKRILNKERLMAFLSLSKPLLSGCCTVGEVTGGQGACVNSEEKGPKSKVKSRGSLFSMPCQQSDYSFDWLMYYSTSIGRTSMIYIEVVGAIRDKKRHKSVQFGPYRFAAWLGRLDVLIWDTETLRDEP